MRTYSVSLVSVLRLGLVALVAGSACSQGDSGTPAAPTTPAAAAVPAASAAAAKAVTAAAPTPAAAAAAKSGEPSEIIVFADATEIVGTIPLETKLSVEIQPDTGKPPFKYIWDFGDATPFSTDESPTHVYSVPGNFRASVIVTDSRGETDQDYVDILASAPETEEHRAKVRELMKKWPPGEVMKRALEEAQKKQAGAAANPSPDKPNP